MSKCGPYHLERTIGWGRTATFFSARIDDATGAAELVVRRARLAELKFSQNFLRAAAEQQAAIAAGCRQLAPILHFESDDDGFAYYATTHYATSLGLLLDEGCALDSPSLREIVSGILDALTELHGKAHRPHGNLSAGNVLFDKDQNVVLTDLAPTGKDATPADDLIGLGTIIYQFVRRQVRVGKLIPPLEYSPDWTECFGDDAVGWLIFTNGLLTRSGGEKSDALKIAAKELKSLSRLAAKVEKPAITVAAGHPTVETRPRPPKKRSPLPKIAAALVLLAAVGGAGFLYWKKKHPVVAPEPPPKPPPENIERLAKELKQPINPGDNLNSDPSLLRILKRIRDSLGEHGSEDDVRARLSDWDAPKAMTARAEEWRKPKRDWARLADELEAAANVDLQGPRPIMEQLRDAVGANRNSDALEKRWTEIAAVLVKLTGSRTQAPMLPDFEKWAVREIRSQPLDTAAKAAAATKKTLDEIHEFVKTDGPRIHQARFEKEASSVLKEPGEEQFRSWPADWLQQAKRYLRPRASDMEKWQASAAKAEVSIGKIAADKKAVWTPKLQTFRNRIPVALESEADELDILAKDLGTVRSPNEDAHESYLAILKSWKNTATAASSLESAKSSLKEFTRLTGELPPDYRTKAHIKDAIDAMTKAIATPEVISLQFSQPGWTLLPGTATADRAVYSFGGVSIPFIALGRDNMAMAAVETPLVLAKLSGSLANPPEDGPQIRASDFSPTANWLWPRPATFMRGNNIPDYFAGGVTAGDLGSDACPVTWLTYAEAYSMAEKLGGRLPTSEQWISALGKEGLAKRLRASAWTAQFNQITNWPTVPGKLLCFPNRGSFSKSAGLRPSLGDYMNDPEAAAGATNDKALWLTSVFPSGARWKPNDDAARFHHLIGNAAEWVTAANEPAIIGGSVVSSPKLATREPLKGSRGAAAFDVTFRLAVPLGEGGAGDGLRKFLDAARNIEPPSVAPSD